MLEQGTGGGGLEEELIEQIWKSEALGVADKYLEKRQASTTVFWEGLSWGERTTLQRGGWTPGMYLDHIQPAFSSADVWHDPVTYLLALTGGAGIARAGWNAMLSNATIYGGANIVSLGSNGLYQKPGHTYFELPGPMYDTLNKVGLARALNVSFMNNQIAQDKAFIVSLLNPRTPGIGTQMEMGMLRAAQYYEGTGNWLGVDRLFQPSTWQWIGKAWQ